MNLSNGFIRFVKGALSVMVATLVSYLADSANLTGFLNASVATIVAGMFLVIEGWVKDKGKGALFGVARKQTYSDY